MPSPFPGMDPFIETYEWSDFHHRLMTYISDDLMDRLPAGERRPGGTSNFHGVWIGILMCTIVRRCAKK